MHKVMIADLVKASYEEYKDERDLAIKEIMDKWDISYSEAEYLYENYTNEADQRQVLEAAEALGIGIEDISDDDVEAMNQVEATAVGKIESSAAEFVYKLAIGTGLYYLWATFSNGKVVMYQNLEPSDIKGIIDNGGEYYVNNIRIDSSEPRPDDPNVGCGCEHNPCSPAQIAAKPQI